MTTNHLWYLVKNGFINTTDHVLFAAITNNKKTQLRGSRRKDAKALRLIEAALTEALFPRIAAANYSKEGWDILETTFKWTDKVRVV